MRRNVALAVSLLFILCYAAGADTIHAKKGREIRGVIVEDFKDRFILSTEDGEIMMLKKFVKDVTFDTNEDNLMMLAELARSKGDNEAAYSYYESALKINPGSKKITDAMTSVRGNMLAGRSAGKLGNISMMEAADRGLSQQAAQQESNVAALNAKLKDMLGMSLERKSSNSIVTEVVPASQTAEAGIIKGDILVAVWGRLTGYVPLRVVIKDILDSPSADIKGTFERKITIKKSKDVIGAMFSMPVDGLTVSRVIKDGSAEAAGLKEGDLVVAINGESTRYMPLNKAMELVKRSQGDVILTIRRDLTIWKQKEARI